MKEDLSEEEKIKWILKTELEEIGIRRLKYDFATLFVGVFLGVILGTLLTRFLCDLSIYIC